MELLEALALLNRATAVAELTRQEHADIIVAVKLLNTYINDAAVAEALVVEEDVEETVEDEAEKDE